MSHMAVPPQASVKNKGFVAAGVRTRDEGLFLDGS